MYGTQGLNITKMVSDVTKMAIPFTDEMDIQDTLELLHATTISGRPGPCWLDVPMNLQAKKVEKHNWVKFFYYPDEPDTNTIIEALNNAKRPVIIGGHGVRLADAKDEFRAFIDKLKAPTLLTWSGIDLLDNGNPYFFGRFGLYGQRAANFIVQNADLVLVFGSRLALPQVGYDFSQFARDAKVIVVDIDEIETKKYPVTHIKADCLETLENLLGASITTNDKWLEQCNGIKERYPWVDEKIHKDNGYLNSYKFIDRLSNHLADNHIITTDMGTALLSGHQAIKLKPNQTMFTSLGLGEMGYGLPGALGAQAACPDRPVLCLNCDGGIMMNLQELHTIIENEMPIKIIIFNNDGYLMIKHTQKMLFKGDYVSVDKKTGIGLPDFSKLMPAFGYNYYGLKKWEDFDMVVNAFINNNKATVLEVFMDPEQDFVPKVKGVLKEDGSIFPPPIEEMSPLLPFEVIKNEMVAGISEKSKLIKR
jgi:acetolactate synthase-1/2/3 large subunit